MKPESDTTLRFAGRHDDKMAFALFFFFDFCYLLTDFLKPNLHLPDP